MQVYKKCEKIIFNVINYIVIPEKKFIKINTRILFIETKFSLIFN